MSWLQVELRTPAGVLSRVEDILLESSAAAVTLLSDSATPVLEPDPGATPLWSHLRVRALLPLDTDMARLQGLLSEIDGIDPATLEISFVGPDDWQHGATYETVDKVFAGRLHLRPKPLGRTATLGRSEGVLPVPLFLEPGLAFGSGSHPTTRLCLEWLAGNVQPETRVLDFGCGSGVLGLAAALLGARVVAVDHDPQAVVASQDNAAYNGIGQDRLAVKSSADWLAGDYTAQFDVVIANILAGPLAELAATFEQICRPGGRIVLSGVLQQQAEDLVCRYQNTDFHNIAEEAGWVRLDGRRHASA